MSKKYNNKTTIVIVLILLIGLVIVNYLAQQRQIVEREAAGSNEVNITLDPAATTINPGQTFSADIIINKTVERPISISGGDIILHADARFTFDSASCDSQFDGLSFEQTNGQEATVICVINIDAEPIALTSEPVVFANVLVKVNDNAENGPASITFSTTRITETGVEGQIPPDVSTAGEVAKYTISDSIVTATPTVVASPTDDPLPKSSTSPPCGDMKLSGNYNCDIDENGNSIVDEQDFSDWLNDFIQKLTSLSFFEYWRRIFYSE